MTLGFSPPTASAGATPGNLVAVTRETEAAA